MSLRRFPLMAVAGLGIGVLAGCAAIDSRLDDDDENDTVRLACDEGRDLTLEFRDDGDEVVVDTEDDSFRLDLQDRNGDRYTYGDGDVRLIVEGDQAELRIEGDEDYQDCEARR